MTFESELLDKAIATGKDAIAIAESISGDRDLYKSLCATQAEIIKAHEATLAEIEWLCDGREDIDNNGGPNLAMQIMTRIKGDA
jgi:hypothetical protein